MRQVPEYLLIGNGRVAKHFQHYFALLHISHSTWNRSESFAKLNNQIVKSTHVLILINDQNIENFIKQYLQKVDLIRIHFSGSLVSSLGFGAHPLMSFGHHLYSLEQYQKIPFIVDDDAPSFDELFPQLQNPYIRLNKSLKEKYHALCVLSGNFSCMLWQKLFSSLESEFNIPANFAQQYMLQQTQNLLLDPASALTGPLVRNDITTLKNNIAALESDPFQPVYESFVACYNQIKQRELA